MQKLFGQCPNARNAISNGASLIKAYRLTKFKIAVEGIWKVSEGCLKSVWRVSGGCLGVSGGCLEVSRGCIGV